MNDRFSTSAIAVGLNAPSIAPSMTADGCRTATGAGDCLPSQRELDDRVDNDSASRAPVLRRSEERLSGWSRRSACVLRSGRELEVALGCWNEARSARGMRVKPQALAATTRAHAHEHGQTTHHRPTRLRRRFRGDARSSTVAAASPALRLAVRGRSCGLAGARAARVDIGESLVREADWEVGDARDDDDER